MTALSTFSKRERYLFVIFFITMAFLLLYNYAIEPFLERWEYLDKQIILNRTRLTEIARLLKDRNPIVCEYNRHIVPFKNISDFISHIEKQSSSLGIITANLIPKPVIQQRFYREYIVELQIEGRQDAINQFVSNIVKPPVCINVKKFDLRSNTEHPLYLKGTLTLSKIVI